MLIIRKNRKKDKVIFVFLDYFMIFESINAKKTAGFSTGTLDLV
jgi:hypothetical protein